MSPSTGPYYRATLTLLTVVGLTCLGLSKLPHDSIDALAATTNANAALVRDGGIELIQGRRSRGGERAAQASPTGQEFLVPNFFADIVERTLPSVVSVYVKYDLGGRRGRGSNTEERPGIPPELREFFQENQPPPTPPGDRPEARTSGSGVVVSREGHILTNNHIVQNALMGRLSVVLNDDREIPSDKIQVVLSDTLLDLAILKIDAEGLDLTPIPWGDSNSLRIGDWVLAMGNPLDLRGSVSKGIVSAKGRQIGVADIEHLIQTDAMINPGNSGGPLVNIRGELVGINVAIATNSGFFQGIGFAIPSNDAKRVYDQIMEHGRILRGYVGVFLHDLEDDLTKRALGVPVETRGVVVINVVKDGPAAKAGVQMWDVITHVDDIAVSAFPELLRVVSQKEIGDRAKLGILRPTGDEPEKLSLQMEVTERPAENAVSEVVRERRVGQGEVPTLARSGLTLKPSGAGGPEGVEIVEVAARSAGARAGLRKGDIIMEIDHQPIASVDDARRAMAAHQGGRPMLVLYWGTRDRETREMLTGLDVD